MTRTFEVIYNSNSRIIQPYEADSLVYEWDYDDELSIWRKQLKGSLIFGSETGDYDYFFNIDVSDPCNTIILNIYTDCQSEPEFTGKFSTYIAKWDLDKCILSVEVDPYDKYTCVLEKIDNEIDLFKFDSWTVSIKPPQGSFEQMKKVRIMTDDCPDCGDVTDDTEYYLKIGNAWVQQPNPLNLSEWCFVSDNIYAQTCFHEDLNCPAGQYRRTTWYYSREIMVNPCDGNGPVAPQGGGWNLLVDNCAIDGTATWFRCTGGATADTIEYNNGRSLMTSLDEIVSNMGCGLNGIRSIFFNYNPDITNPIYIQTNNGVLNYVTGQSNCVDKLLWMHITDAKDPQGSDPANSYLTSLSEILNQLRFMFNIRWKIDDDNYMIIEHVSYWTQQESNIDLLIGDKLVAQQRLNRYDKTIEEIPKTEEFAMTEGEYLSSVHDFDKQVIEYNANCAKGDTQTYVADKLVTNIYDITAHPTAYTDDAIVIVATEQVGINYIIVYEQGIRSNWLRKNGHLSMGNLLNRYHKHERPYKEGKWNALPILFYTWAATIGQESAIEFVHCCGDAEFDPDNMFITVLGNKLNSYGYVDKASLQLKSDKLSLLFRYKLT
jgi:hypothetical protein